jgi:quinol monooxygenase YgiN
MVVPPRRRPVPKGVAVFARTITIDARPESVEDGLRYVRDEVFEAITSMPGCVGMSMVTDRESGRCIATTAWESQDTMRASEQSARVLRERSASIFGSSPHVEEWELVIMHRNHPAPDGACVRSTWVEGDPSAVDRTIDVYKMTTIPAIEQLEGFCSASLMVNRQNGRGISTVTYDSRSALDRSREAAMGIRSSTTSESGLRVTDLHEFELVMAHLHVPEMV